MYSCFAELPDCILNSCLRLTSFEAKLRCQQVCRSWRSLLNRSAASGDACETSLSDLWGTCVYLNQPRGEQGQKLLIFSPHKQLQSYT